MVWPEGALKFVEAFARGMVDGVEKGEGKGAQTGIFFLLVLASLHLLLQVISTFPRNFFHIYSRYSKFPQNPEANDSTPEHVTSVCEKEVHSHRPYSAVFVQDGYTAPVFGPAGNVVAQFHRTFLAI